jgi:glycosyltransferase involved in cell wall biosynthesis
MPKLSILIATVPTRNKELEHLTSLLAPQLTNEVEVIVYWDNFEEKLGVKRQALLGAAKGEYVCFIDDDDEIPPYYIAKILPLLDGVDYIGWKQQLYHNGEKMKPTYHSLAHSVSEDENGWYRDISHLNPMRRELALKGRFDRTSPEDNDWSNQLRGIPKTEHFIDEVMYNYHHSTEGSLWNQNNTPLTNPARITLPKGMVYMGPSRG